VFSVRCELGFISQKTTLFIVTFVKPSNLPVVLFIVFFPSFSLLLAVLQPLPSPPHIMALKKKKKKKNLSRLALI
jgi:hypothetical protein